MRNVQKHDFEPEQDNPDRCANCGNNRSWHPRSWGGR